MLHNADSLTSSIDHQRNNPVFATASNTVHIWDETKYPYMPLMPFVINN